ncbi:GIY-YIG nuclease family protein [Priestia aryabhattai]|uniref:GIY-YIG nuclease family protein n=1 Tax=Priestia aryabhattai TaxID=412384 RepID=UPI001ADD58AE|nr:GIY-YIG nuclease family protein [Priestia aryabhattai]QTL51427.1 GIY-YIG nuclease family protein [Priestia aryabhattai]
MHLYRKMKEVIRNLQDELIAEKKSTKFFLTELKAKDSDLKEIETERKMLIRQISLLEKENKHLVSLNHSYKEKVSKQAEDIARLSILVNYRSSKDQDFKYEPRKYLLVVIKDAFVLIKRLLFMGAQKVRRVKIIYQIKNLLAKYEDCFYKNSFKLDKDAKKILVEVDSYLDKWKNHYEGYMWNAKPVEKRDINRIESILQELHYLSLYKRFEKYKEKVIQVEGLFQILKDKRKIQQNYPLKKFCNEINFMAKQKHIKFEEFFVRRVFQGETYAFLKSFNKINYDFKLLKTYGMYHLLYIYGSYENNTFKVGVTRKNLNNRYMKAKELYEKIFFSDDFQEIKLIESFNALNLETYLKRKFKLNRHPLFKSTEWFLLEKSEIMYFTNNEYQKDTEFMNILSYSLYK